MGFVEKTNFYENSIEQSWQFHPCSRTGTFLSLGLGIQWNVCLPDFPFLGQTLNSAVVSTLNILYEAKLLEIKKNEMKLSDLSVWMQLWYTAYFICWITVRRMFSPLVWVLFSQNVFGKLQKKTLEVKWVGQTAVWTFMLNLFPVFCLAGIIKATIILYFFSTWGKWNKLTSQNVSCVSCAIFVCQIQLFDFFFF